MMFFAAGRVSAKGEGADIPIFCFGNNIPFAYEIEFPSMTPSVVIIATSVGVFYSEDQGERYEWMCPEAYGSGVMSDGTVTDLTRVVTTPKGGVFFLSRNSGYHWLPSFETSAGGNGVCDMQLGGVEAIAMHHLGSLGISQRHPELLVMATGRPGPAPFGIAKSVDEGRSFSFTDLIDNDGAFGGVFIPKAGDQVFVSYVDDSRYTLYRGDEWAENMQPLGAPIRANALSLVYGSDDGLQMYRHARAPGPEACEFSTRIDVSVNRGSTFSSFQNKEAGFVGMTEDADGVMHVGWFEEGVEAKEGDTFVSKTSSRISRMTRDRNKQILVAPVPAEEVQLANGSKEIVFVRKLNGEVFFSSSMIKGPKSCGRLSAPCEDRYERMASRYYFSKTSVPGNPDGGLSDGGTMNPELRTKGCCHLSGASQRGGPSFFAWMGSMLLVFRLRRVRS